VDYAGCDQEGVPETVYFEIWRGVTESFFDFTSLAAGETIAWTESWGPFHGIGGMSCAGEEAVVRFAPPAAAPAGELRVALGLTPRRDRPDGAMRISVDGAQTPFVALPASPAAPHLGEVTIDLSGLSAGAHELTLVYDPGDGAAPVTCTRTITVN
jgi:hypothetical protein